MTTSEIHRLLVDLWVDQMRYSLMTSPSKLYQLCHWDPDLLMDKGL